MMLVMPGLDLALKKLRSAVFFLSLLAYPLSWIQPNNEFLILAPVILVAIMLYCFANLSIESCKSMILIVVLLIFVKVISLLQFFLELKQLLTREILIFNIYIFLVMLFSTLVLWRHCQALEALESIQSQFGNDQAE